MLRVLLFTCFVSLSLFFVKNIQAQDVHYSQRMAGDRQNNPSFLNQFDGSWQAMTVYRNQWQSIGVPFTSSTIFFTKKILTNNASLSFFGGLSYTNDKSGDAKLTANLINATIGSTYKLGKNNISFALSNAYMSKSFDQSGLTFPSQYDRNIGGFNGSLSNGEIFQGEQLNYYDLGMGICVKRQLTSNWGLTGGLSMLHLTEPTESFFERDNVKNRGYGFQFLANHDLMDKIELFPYLSFYRAKGASETILGSSVLFNTSVLGPIEDIQPFIYLRTGIDRLSDALIIGSKANIGNFQFGLSYDINVSELELASNYQGGFELSLIYTAKYLELTKRRIPCERY